MAKSLRSKRKQKIKRLRKKLFYEKDKAKEALEKADSMEVDSQQDTEAVTEDGANLMDTGAKVISNSQLKKLRQNKQNKKLKRLKKKRLEKGRF